MTIDTRMRGAPASGRAALLRSMLGGSQRTHGERVNFLAHAVAKRAINGLVPLHRALTFEERRYDQRLEVLTVTADLKHRALKARGDVTPDIVGSRQSNLTV